MQWLCIGSLDLQRGPGFRVGEGGSGVPLTPGPSQTILKSFFLNYTQSAEKQFIQSGAIFKTNMRGHCKGIYNLYFFVKDTGCVVGKALGSQREAEERTRTEDQDEEDQTAA